MGVITINIYCEKKCTRCKKGGATDNGLCLRCVEKKVKEMLKKENHEKKEQR